jgi:CRP-like cAMP-binding protein
MTTLKKYPLEFPENEHRNCQTLTQLTLDHIPRDGSLGRIRRYRAGADVWQPDDRQDRLYFLLSGEVAIVLSDTEGREVVLHTIEQGAPFGELCFCGAHKLRCSIARSTADGEAVEIRINEFLDYMQTTRDVLAAFVFTFCIRLADAERRVEILAHRGAEDRLGRLLLHLAASRSEANATGSDAVTLPISHDALAQMAAMSRPQVTLTMNGFRRQKLVSYDRNSPLVINASALKRHFSLED